MSSSSLCAVSARQLSSHSISSTLTAPTLRAAGPARRKRAAPRRCHREGARPGSPRQPLPSTTSSAPSSSAPSPPEPPPVSPNAVALPKAISIGRYSPRRAHGGSRCWPRTAASVPACATSGSPTERRTVTTGISIASAVGPSAPALTSCSSLLTMTSATAPACCTRSALSTNSHPPRIVTATRPAIACGFVRFEAASSGSVSTSGVGPMRALCAPNVALYQNGSRRPSTLTPYCSRRPSLVFSSTRRVSTLGPLQFTAGAPTAAPAAGPAQSSAGRPSQNTTE